MEWQRKIYDTFMLNHFWLDYIVMENDGFKKIFFAIQHAPRWGHVGPPCWASWTAPSRVGKICEKKKKFLKSLIIQNFFAGVRTPHMRHRDVKVLMT